MGNYSVQQKLGRARIEVIFEFACPKPSLTIYRGVRATDGGDRMEKRGSLAKKFKPIMWSSGKDSLYLHKRAVENEHRTGVLPFSFIAPSEQAQ
jgi:hypothetical protein